MLFYIIFFNFKMNDENLLSFKVVLVGDSHVGKTSIVKKYIDDSFDEKYIQTEGCSVETKEILIKGYKKFKLHIWDITGKKDYRDNLKTFYKDASAIIFVYDITKDETFQELENFGINEIKENTSGEISK